MTNEEYHADTSRISKSGVELINRSPAHYWEKYLNPNSQARKETNAFAVGTASHTLILEPHLFDRDYFLFDDSKKCDEIGGKNPRATSKYKAWKSLMEASHPTKTPLPPKDYDYFRRLTDAVHSHTAARELLAEGLAEQTVLFDESITGASCKCRPDWLDLRHEIIVDLKTTEDASAEAFGKSALNYGYDMQAAFYLDGLLESGESIAANGFVFIAVEKNPPYAVAVYVAEAEAIKLGRRKYLQGLETYMECRRTGIWPAYGNDIKPLRLPHWAYK